MVEKLKLIPDGGGVRSYSTLLILSALMGEIRSVARENEGMDYSLHIGRSTLTTKGDAIANSIQPCDVFSYMFGSSSGG